MALINITDDCEALHYRPLNETAEVRHDISTFSLCRLVATIAASLENGSNVLVKTDRLADRFAPSAWSENAASKDKLIWKLI